MSLFGGDAPAQPASDSSFSISPISSDSNQGQRAELHLLSAQLAQGDETPNFSTDSDEETENGRDGEAKQSVDTDVHERDRFAGSDSLWRYYNQDEIALTKSLNDLRGNDLSAHLYNAHAWKARLRVGDAMPSALTRKSRWILRDKTGNFPWYPDTKWTAWPLEPDLVPAPNDVFWRQSVSGNDDNEDHPAASSSILSDALLTTTLGLATSQWRARSPSESDQPTQQATRGNELHMATTSTSIERNMSSPVLLSDDSEARRRISPAISSIMSRLDGLFMALHHNCAGQHANDRDQRAYKLRGLSLSRSRTKSADMRSRSRRRSSSKRSPSEVGAESHSEIDQDETRSPKRRKLKSTPRDDHEDRDRTGHRASSVTSSTSDASGSDGGHKRSTRDWSEILGLASLSGWDPLTVERARMRCARLFNESMDFSTMGEIDEALAEHPAASKSRPFIPLVPSVPPVQQPKIDDSKQPVYFCPFPDCHHHHRGWRPAKGSKFRYHMKHKHNFSDTQMEELEETLQSAWQAQASNDVTSWVAPDPLVCPYAGCPWASKSFQLVRRFTEHMRRKHGYDPRYEFPPNAEARDPSDQETADATYKDATAKEQGVHLDGFLQPIHL